MILNYSFDMPKKIGTIFKAEIERFLQKSKLTPMLILYGGRASGKTANIIRYLLTRAMLSKTKILCTREIQNSIEQSTYAEIKELIYECELDNPVKPVHFIIQKDGIYCSNGSQFMFRGLARDINQIKSIPGIDICFVEEAETINERTWEVLDPTIRKQNSQMIISFNPVERLSATYQRFVEAELGDKAIKLKVNYDDNPFLSSTMKEKIEMLKTINYDKYKHIYLGEVIDMSDSLVFKNKFQIRNDINLVHNGNYWVYTDANNLTHIVEPVYGLDFGFSQDPVAIVECFMLDAHTIYIHREIYEYRLLVTQIRNRVKALMPEALTKLFYADNSRPDSIAQLNTEGLYCKGADKGKGSVESGIDWLLCKNLIVNSNCENTIFELYNYKYKIDKNTDRVTTCIIDENNHAIDAIRYAFYKQIQSKTFSYDSVDWGEIC